MKRRDYLQSKIIFLCSTINEEKLEYLASMAEAAARNSEAPIEVHCERVLKGMTVGRRLYFAADLEQRDRINAEMFKIIS